MKRKYWLALVTVAAISLALVMSLTILSVYVYAAGPPWYVNGDWDSWASGIQMYDDGSHGDATSGDGTYTTQVHVTSAGEHEFKVNDGGAEWYPTSGNAWFYAASDDYTATLTFDTNTYTDGWEPNHYIVNADDDHTDWIAVGDWQGWDNANSATAMSAVGDHYELTTYIATASTYQFKAVITGTWNALGPDGGGNSGGRSVNASNVSFTTSQPEQRVTFYADPGTGRIKVHVWTPVVINEFTSKGTEWIELYNTTNQGIDVSGWSVWDGTGTTPGSSDTNFPGGTIGAGGYLAWSSTLSFDNSGSHVWLIDGSLSMDPIVDMVGYGDLGAAPIGPSASGAAQYSTARVSDGWDTDDDAQDWNLDPTPTQGSANDVAGNNLGGSLIINEVDLYPSTGNDMLELYNPTTQPVDVTGWYVSDGDDCAQFTGTLSVPAQGFLALEETVDWISEGSTGVDFSSSDVAYLFDDNRVRLDQLGFNGHFWSGSAQRIPDGAGPNEGYDWSSSGGGITLFDLPATLGGTNTPGPVDMTIEKTGNASVAPSGQIEYVVTYNALKPMPAAAIVITDYLPAEVDLVSYAALPPLTELSTEPLAWSAGSLSGFPSGIITITVQVSDTVLTGADLVNTVEIAATGEMTPGNNTDVFTTTVVGQDVSVTKTGPADPLRPGDLISYTIDYGVASVEPAQDVELTDLFPDGFEYLTYSAPLDLSCEELLQPPDVIGLVCSATQLVDPGQIVVTGTVAAVPTNYVITNTVEITASNDGDAVNNEAVYVNHLVVPIYEIQTVPDPAIDDASPYLDQHVWVEGVATVSSDSLGGDRYFIEDPAGGPWSGLYVYTHGDRSSVQEGDWVLAYGLIDEYYEMTELNISDGEGGQHQVLSSTNPLPSPEVLPTGDFATGSPATAEPYEGVLLEFRGATVTDEDLGYGEWQFDDGSGATRADDLSQALTYVPALGDYYVYIRGLGEYDYSDYKIVPRYDADIVQPTYLSCEKEGPASVEPGSLFTYTITTVNETGIALAHVVMTDALPSSLAISAISDGGVDLGGNVVSWTITSLAVDELVTRTVAVTAPATYPVILINDDYTAWASNWTTRTTGLAVSTLVNTSGGVVPIHTIQGSGAASPLAGVSGIAIEGVVVGDFQGSDHLRGFFVQEEDTDVDADPLTSEGIFVYDGSFGVDVSVGDQVHVAGTVSEYYGLTRLDSVTSVTVLGPGSTTTPATIDLPVAAVDDLERYEGMSMTVPEVLYATETYDLRQYGEVLLSADGRLFNPTQVTTPGAAANALQAENDLRRLLLDDGSGVSNPASVPYLGDQDTLRLGDTVTGLSGALTYSFGEYILEPTGTVAFTRENARTTAPEETAGAFEVASFNVLNYFNGDGHGGGFPTSRGATTLDEFIRQRDKIIAAIVAIDADVIGLMEIENDGYDQYSAIQDLVNGLNDATAPGTYAFIDFGDPVGTDEIIQGILYQPATATPIGAPAVLDSSVDATYLDTKNRPAMAQTFEAIANGERLTVVVNHLKSKGSSCDDVGDPDTGDGQGNCNVTRTDAAIAETTWLAGDPTGSLDPDALIIGDLNSYAMEDPITAIKNAGYTDLQAAFVGPEAYTYVFEGQAGSLDQALANSSLAPQVVGTTIWHINADEPTALDYRDYNPPELYQPDAYRASDHDPVIVRLFAPALTLTKQVTPTTGVDLGDVVTYTITLDNEGEALAAGVMMTDDLPAEVSFGGWVQQNGASEADGTLTWTGDIANSTQVVFVFTATVNADPDLYGQTITNTADFTSANAGTGSDDAVFALTSPPGLIVTKDVEPTADVELGGVVTYTIVLNNGGDTDAQGVVVTDVLPDEVDFGGWVRKSGASQAGDTVSWTGDVASGMEVVIVFTATVGTDEGFYGQTVTNDATYTSDNAGSGLARAEFTIVGAPLRYYLPIIFQDF
jgi:uncharacterized repeat protein (TIGR01451 family)